MDVWFMRFLFFVCVQALVILEINAQETHDFEGRTCVGPGGEDGVCLQLPQCPSVVHAITCGIRNHTRCGFIGGIELVCCTEQPLRADATKPASPDNLQTATPLPPTTPVAEASTRNPYLLPPHFENNSVTSDHLATLFNIETTFRTINSLEKKLVSTVHSITSHAPETTSDAVNSREHFVEDTIRDIEDVNLDTNRGNADGIDDRIFLGNNEGNKISPTLFAFNTLTGFVNAFLGKPPNPPRATRPHPVTKRPLLRHVTKPPLLRTVTKPPMLIRATPMYILPNVRDVTRKPGTDSLPTISSTLSTTHKPILNFQPNEILSYKPKPSLTPERDENPSSTGQNVISTHIPEISDTRPEYPFIPKPFPIPGSETDRPFSLVHVPLKEKPNIDETTLLNILSKPTHFSGESVYTSTPAIFVFPVTPDFEPAPTEIPGWPDPHSTSSDVFVIPDVPYETAIPPEKLDIGSVPSENHPSEENRPTSVSQSESESSSENTTVGSKSQEACARYRKMPKLTRYIVGGDYAAHGEFPHMVALGFQRPRQEQLTWMCGGTLLNEQYVLTAAHCVVTRFGRPLAARMGYTNLTADASTGVEVAVGDAHVHPAYDALARAHDIALLRLATPVSYSQFVHPACLYAARAPPLGPLLVTGWGSITPDGATPTDHMMRASVTPVDDGSCWEAYRRIFRPEMICAAGEEVDTCKGDSGGPMQYLAEPGSIYTVVGVTSFGPNPCASTRPGVYSRVASYLPWIEGIVWSN